MPQNDSWTVMKTTTKEKRNGEDNGDDADDDVDNEMTEVVVVASDSWHLPRERID